jgi:hypothetical protein
MRKLYVMLLAISLFSCKEKEHYFTVSGRVLNGGNKEPIVGAVVKMNDGIESGGGVLGTGQSYEVLKSETKTDSNGYYYLQLKTKKEYIYTGASSEQLFNGLNEYFSEGNNKTTKYNGALPEGVHTNIDFYLYRSARTNSLKFKAKEPFESDSVFIYDIQTTWGLESSGKKSIAKTSNEIEIDHGYVVKADRYLVYKIRYKRDNLVWETKVDSFYVEGNKVYDKVVWF